MTAHSAAMQKLRSKPQLGTYAFGTSKILEVLIFKFVAVCCHFKGGTYGKMRIDQFMEWDTAETAETEISAVVLYGFI